MGHIWISLPDNLRTSCSFRNQQRVPEQECCRRFLWRHKIRSQSSVGCTSFSYALNRKNILNIWLFRSQSSLNVSVGFVLVDHWAKRGLAGVQLGPGCRRALYLHRRGPRTKFVLQRCQEQAASSSLGEGRANALKLFLAAGFHQPILPSRFCCNLMARRCRTCPSPSRCWTCEPRGIFSMWWRWRTRWRAWGPNSDSLRTTGNPSWAETIRSN